MSVCLCFFCNLLGYRTILLFILLCILLCKLFVLLKSNIYPPFYSWGSQLLHGKNVFRNRVPVCTHTHTHTRPLSSILNNADTWQASLNEQGEKVTNWGPNPVQFSSANGAVMQPRGKRTKIPLPRSSLQGVIFPPPQNVVYVPLARLYQGWTVGIGFGPKSGLQVGPQDFVSKAEWNTCF